MIKLSLHIGYGVEKFGYRLWDPKKRRVIRSRDIVFHKQETMPNYDALETSAQGGMVDLTPTIPIRRIATEGGELDDKFKVDNEPKIEYDDCEGVE